MILNLKKSVEPSKTPFVLSLSKDERGFGTASYASEQPRFLAPVLSGVEA